MNVDSYHDVMWNGLDSTDIFRQRWILVFSYGDFSAVMQIVIKKLETHDSDSVIRNVYIYTQYMH